MYDHFSFILYPPWSRFGAAVFPELTTQQSIDWTVVSDDELGRHSLNGEDWSLEVARLLVEGALLPRWMGATNAVVQAIATTTTT